MEPDKNIQASNLNQSSLTDNQAPVSQLRKKHIWVVALIILAALALGGGAVYMIFTGNKVGRPQNLPEREAPPGETQSATVPTVSPLSSDDSIDTMEKELDETATDDFSSDFQQINQDINSL